MSKIFISIVFIAATTFAQAQTKDSAFLQTKKEKAEIKEADQHRLHMEKEQLKAAPEIMNNEKIVSKKTSRKHCCKAKKCKKTS